MHAILSASAGQEQLLIELLVSYGKVRLLRCGSEPCARPSALSQACRVDNVQFWNKIMKDLLYHRQRLWWFASVAFLKKLKVKLEILLAGFWFLSGGCGLFSVPALWLQICAPCRRCPSHRTSQAVAGCVVPWPCSAPQGHLPPLQLQELSVEKLLISEQCEYRLCAPRPLSFRQLQNLSSSKKTGSHSGTGVNSFTPPILSLSRFLFSLGN